MNSKFVGFKLIVFILVTTITGMGVATVVGNLRFGATREYQAIFQSAAGLGSGEDVRIGGVPSGKVASTRLQPDGTALVSFTVDSTHTLTAGTEAAIKYKNLIGDRYLDLSQGKPTSAPLDGPIPIEQTIDALDLDQVVNGFRPLLTGLDPAQTNQLTASLIQVLNGQESAVGELVTQLGSLSGTLAERDSAIGNVVTSFNTTLASMDSRRDNLDLLVDQLQQVVGGLEGDSDTISTSLLRIDELTGAFSGVLADNRPDLGAEITSLQSLAGQLNGQTDTLNDVLGRLPEIYRLTARASSYGSFVNFFVCGLAVKYGNGDSDVSPMFTAPAERCK